MRILVIYYSYEGNTKFVAQTIASTVKADLLELKPEKEINAKGFMKYIWGGRQVLMKARPVLKELDKDLVDYDLLFIGTPVWAWSYAPPLNTFFHSANFQGKKIALFCCHGGSKGKTLEKMASRLRENEIIAIPDFFEPLKKDKTSVASKVAQWALEVVDNANTRV